MSDCLVTTLKGKVADDSLPRIGDFTIDVIDGNATSTKLPYFSISCEGNGTIIAENGTFLSDDLADLGAEVSFTGSTKVRLSESTTAVRVRCGYSFYSIGNVVSEEPKRKLAIKAANLKYQKKLTGLSSNNILSVRIASGEDAVAIIENNPDIAGVTLEYLEGDFPLDVLASRTKVAYLSLKGANGARGDIASLASLTPLWGIELGARTSPTGALTGDLAKLPPSVAYLNCAGSPDTYTWRSERSTSCTPLSLVGVRLGSYVDAMLIDRARNTGGSPMGTGQQKITVIGTRTSASDTAVSALQAAGWTVTVTPES